MGLEIADFVAWRNFMQNIFSEVSRDIVEELVEKAAPGNSLLRAHLTNVARNIIERGSVTRIYAGEDAIHLFDSPQDLQAFIMALKQAWAGEIAVNPSEDYSYVDFELVTPQRGVATENTLFVQLLSGGNGYSTKLEHQPFLATIKGELGQGKRLDKILANLANYGAYKMHFRNPGRG